MRTAAEAVAWYNTRKGDDLFGFAGEIIFQYIPFEVAKPYLTPEATQAEWEADLKPLTHEQCLTDARAYMAFAWEKVADHRGLSAGRSVIKLTAWCALLGEDELVAFANDESHYKQYGAPILKAISERLGFPIPDDARLVRMADGLPCRPDCEEGCGTHR